MEYAILGRFRWHNLLVGGQLFADLEGMVHTPEFAPVSPSVYVKGSCLKCIEADRNPEDRIATGA
jgi:hypothetical protein